MGILSLSGKIRKLFSQAQKFLFFQQDQTTITQKDRKGFTWHKHLLKHKNHNHNSSITVPTLKNRKQKAKKNYSLGCLPTSDIVLCP